MSAEAQTARLKTVTSTHLLEALRDPGNRTVWRNYVERYRPVVVAHARRLGLSDTDAEDVAQETLVAFCQAYRDGKYDRSKGRLRDWLFGIARNQLRNWCRRRGAEAPAASSGVFEGLAAEDEWEQLWERQWRDAVLRQCLEEIRAEVDPRTFEAFERFASQGWPAQRVAEHLGVTTNAVFLAKHRILKRVRELLPHLEEVW
jgi:RNA polymerase sigma-70 factor (ECF subfamily)